MNPAIRNGKTLVIVAYSLGVMATILPGFNSFPGWIALPYYLVVPGYCVTILLRQNKHIVDLVFYTFVWSLAVVGSVFAVETLFQSLSSLPLGAAIPVLTMAVAAFDHYFR